ncbi:metal-dependent hydrolase [Paenactinomyces guangxiensis]|uniref:Metal-dependent hydrolase n=1 Tax=Paenactinomyces guangxiensis TaxID=1490290 RepID=A0A7W2AAS0_9BACL|nr:metal-dependent hydrolase [Paenactinomyces guangxiensis]MBA4496547.1 metal-dependent hydrolase [Paenactinomyces guangxiensis]MBH8593674.1 metal-dependent hydrolase [Paenactinomyces guangxiensis]
MEGRTHFAIGIACGVGLACTVGDTKDVMNLSLTIITAGMASILPDIDEDGSLINNFIFPSLKRTYRSFALAAIGVVMVLMYFLKGLPDWVLYTGIFAAGVAYVPHRSVTHSFLSCAYITWIIYQAVPEYTYAVAIGYMSHLLADAVTSAGVPFLWPYSKKFSLKKLGIKVKSGGTVDRWVARIALILSCIGFLYLIGQVFYDEATAAGWIS